MPETIGEIIRKLREERNMSQIGLAWAANVRATSINNYEPHSYDITPPLSPASSSTIPRIVQKLVQCFPPLPIAYYCDIAIIVIKEAITAERARRYRGGKKNDD